MTEQKRTVTLPGATLMLGDCLERMKEIPSRSIDMILTDPPYGTIKGKGAGTSLSYYEEKTQWDNVVNVDEMFKECDRILRKNGALVLFCQDPFTYELVNKAPDNLPLSYRLTWDKGHFGSPLSAKKAPLNYTEDVLVFFKKHDVGGAHPVRDWFNSELEKTGLTMKEINGILGTKMATHHFGNSAQFAVPSESAYEKLRTTGFFNRDRLELKELTAEFNKSFPKVFNLPEGKGHRPNILKFRKEGKSFHPTQKPTDLLVDLLETYTNKGDKVLDFTMGSGSTGVACVKSGRVFTGIELGEEYFGVSVDRITKAINQEG